MAFLILAPFGCKRAYLTAKNTGKHFGFCCFCAILAMAKTKAKKSTFLLRAIVVKSF